MSELEKCLEMAAKHALYQLAKADSYDAHGVTVTDREASIQKDREVIVKVLNERLLPLLEAGEACRKRLDYADMLPRDIQTGELWDAALRKAMKP